MKAIFEFKEGDKYDLYYPSKPRGIYKSNIDGKERPFRVTFINRPSICDKEQEKWIWFCKQAILPYSAKRESILADDMSDAPVSKETQESIINLMTKAATDKVGTGLTLIPWYSILAIGKIFIEGLRYGRDNWKKGVGDKEYQEERLEHAMLHLLKWKEGDRSEAHLAKVAWFCVTQLELERLEQLQKDTDVVSILECYKNVKEEFLPFPKVLTGEDVGTHSAHCPSAVLKETHYDQYRDALSKHFGKLVESYTNCEDCIIIRFRSSFDQDLVLYYDKDQDKVAALPDIKLYTK